MNSLKIECVECNILLSKNYFENHLKTKKHLKNIEEKNFKERVRLSKGYNGLDNLFNSDILGVNLGPDIDAIINKNLYELEHRRKYKNVMEELLEVWVKVDCEELKKEYSFYEKELKNGNIENVIYYYDADLSGIWGDYVNRRVRVKVKRGGFEKGAVKYSYFIGK